MAIIRNYIVANMKSVRVEAQVFIDKMAHGDAPDPLMVAKVLIGAIGAYKAASSATEKGLRSYVVSETDVALLQIAWKQSDDEVNQRLSEIIGSLPERSSLRTRLTWSRRKYP